MKKRIVTVPMHAHRGPAGLSVCEPRARCAGTESHQHQGGRRSAGRSRPGGGGAGPLHEGGGGEDEREGEIHPLYLRPAGQTERHAGDPQERRGGHGLHRPQLFLGEDAPERRLRAAAGLSQRRSGLRGLLADVGPRHPGEGGMGSAQRLSRSFAVLCPL